MDFEGLLSTISSVVNTAGDVAEGLGKFKSLMQSGQASPADFASGSTGATPMAPFRPQTRDPYAGGQQWIGQLQQVAAQNGNAWVPEETAGALGIDLTGLWASPMNPMDQSYIRQYGPYLNIVAGVGGVPMFLAEGLFDPRSGGLQLAGRYADGSFGQAQAQVMPNWTMQGVMAARNNWGMQNAWPLALQRIA